MKPFIPALLFLGACTPATPDLAPVLRELAELRHSVDECRRVQQPAFDSSLAMENLAKEVRRLREQQSQSPVAPAPAPVLLPVLPSAGGGLTGGVGGTTPNVQDLYWVLTKVSVDGQERVVLAQYRAKAEGRGFTLSGMRTLSADFQLVEYN
jgi:hypothetical protein